MDELGHDGSTSRQETTAPDRQLGHLMINDNTSYYISNALWTSLSHEVFYLGEVLPIPNHHEAYRMIRRLKNCAT